jgi:hypothetical protein
VTSSRIINDRCTLFLSRPLIPHPSAPFFSVLSVSCWVLLASIIIVLCLSIGIRSIRGFSPLVLM